MEGAGVEEVGGFCVDRNISNRGCSCKDRSENRDLRELVYVRRPDLRVVVLKERTLAERQDCRNAVCKRVCIVEVVGWVEAAICSNSSRVLKL